MAGADGGQLRDVTRWAASFMVRLFTAGATSAQLLAEEDVVLSDGDSLYRSVSTEEEEDDVEPNGDNTGRRSSELGPDADESDQQQLLAADEGEDPRRARSVCCEQSLSHGGAVHNTMGSKAREELRRRRSMGAAPRSGDAAAESEPLVLRRRAAKQANDVVETIDHPFSFGCGRREKESSSLLLLSSS